jgi:hypothetical protein
MKRTRLQLDVRPMEPEDPDDHIVYIGIDNGVSGSIGVMMGNRVGLLLAGHYTRSEQDYVKKKQRVSRIDVPQLREFLDPWGGARRVAMIERPMVNPHRFRATASALRALEATLILLEELGVSREFLDSKKWQRVLLPDGVSGSPELKRASREIGSRMFPSLAEDIKRHGDADGLLIAEYCRRFHCGLL